MSDRRRLVCFYAVAVAITVVVMATTLLPAAPDVVPGLLEFANRHRLVVNLVTIIRYALEQPWAWLICLFAAAPSIAAVVLASVEGGGALSRLLARFTPWTSGTRPSAVRFYVAAFATSAFVMVWFYLEGGRQATTDQLAFRTEALGSSLPAVAGYLLLSHFTDEGGTLEELGWRGYALPILLQRYSPLAASIMLGAIWMAWHLPREVPGLIAGRPLGPFLEGQLVFLVLTIALSVLCTVGYLATGGSVLPAILIHGGTNVWSKALGGPLARDTMFGFDPRTVIVVALAIGVLAIGRRGFTVPPRRQAISSSI